VTSRIALDLLGTVFSLGFANAQIARVVTELWEPLIVQPERPGIALDVGGGLNSWTVAVGDKEINRGKDPWMLTEVIRLFMIGKCLRGLRDVIAIHAAAVGHEDHALVLVGPSGAGKSTLTIELVRRGWSYLTDDVVAISLLSERVLPFPKPIGIKQVERWEGMEEWPAGRSLPHPTNGFLFPPSFVGPVQMQPLPLGSLIFLDRVVTGGIALESVSIAESVASMGTLAVEMDRSAIKAILRICGNARRARLTFTEVHSAIRAIEDWLCEDQEASSLR
jgi:hypothetical protein